MMSAENASTLQVIMDEEGCWEDLSKKGFIRGELRALAALSHGTIGGKPTVALRTELPNGQTVVAEIPMRLFISAAEALLGRYQNELYDSAELDSASPSPLAPQKS